MEGHIEGGAGFVTGFSASLQSFGVAVIIVWTLHGQAVRALIYMGCMVHLRSRQSKSYGVSCTLVYLMHRVPCSWDMTSRSLSKREDGTMGLDVPGLLLVYDCSVRFELQIAQIGHIELSD